MNELTAAYLSELLNEADIITFERRKVWKQYYDGLVDLAVKGLFTVPSLDTLEYGNGHIFYILTENRDTIMHNLQELGINATTHYVPLHMSQMGKQFRHGDMTTTEYVFNHILRLPMNVMDVDYVIDKVRKIVLENTK